MTALYHLVLSGWMSMISHAFINQSTGMSNKSCWCCGWAGPCARLRCCCCCNNGELGHAFLDKQQSVNFLSYSSCHSVLPAANYTYPSRQSTHAGQHVYGAVGGCSGVRYRSRLIDWGRRGVERMGSSGWERKGACKVYPS